MQALEIKDLVKNYGSLCAVDHVSFTIHPGEVFGLLGPNGAGKTSIIATIVTLQQATSGSVKVFGHDVELSPRKAKSCLGYVPQELVNHGYFSVREILNFHSGYYGLWKNDERITYLLDRLGLTEQQNKKVKQLSGGMKRRLLIAKALVHDPNLVLLDEPTAGVDIELRTTLWDFVKELKAQGKSILLTTHYIEEAEHLCDRVGILQKGKLIKLDKTANLISDFTKRRVELTLKKEVPQVNHPMLHEQKPGSLVFNLPSAAQLGQLLKEINISEQIIDDVRIREGRLEDVMRTILAEST